MPTNHRLLSPSLDLSSDEARALLIRWGKLHAIRSLLSLVAAVIYSWLIVWGAERVEANVFTRCFSVAPLVTGQLIPNYG
jgi:hypothetical protein